MTLVDDIAAPADASERERASTTFDRNLVVTAGAGTGKTTLLVDRLANLLMREPAPVRITDVIALTFTNKAAHEMKLRLRERLRSYLSVRLDREPSGGREKKLHAEVLSLMDRYRLAKSDVDFRAQEALRNIERSEIGTIHSFAATLLRLYPMEAGVDPQFHEDDGTQFERVFDEQWGLWLDQELSLAGNRKEDWKRILKTLPLDQIKELAVSLCSEAVELDRLNASPREKTVPEAIRGWLESLEAKTGALLERHKEERMNEKLVRAAHAVVREFLRSGSISETALTEERSLLGSPRSINKKLKGWLENEAEEAQELVRAARGLCRVDPVLTGLLAHLLIPFALKLRETFVREGFVSFDGLLIRARNLVRDYPRVREELKRQFQAILIDEFQDTDPIQYEILLYLAEQPGRQAKDWRGVTLVPGKIFVVGDPKQSIYAFRRADIEAYLEVVEKIIKAQNGVECRLTTNFRSHAAIIDVVNGVFETLIRPQDGLQPAYIAIEPAPRDDGRAVEGEKTPPLRKVTVRKIVSSQEPGDSGTSRQLEAENLARWLHGEILDKAVVVGPDGEPTRAQPKDVAILLRKLTDIQDYLEPLRRRGIRYVVEGERHFYAVKEIIDAVNLLRAVDNPHDKLALVGVLRSPLGGLTDQAIYRLHQEQRLDYRTAAAAQKKTLPLHVVELCRTLAELHEETRRLPVGEAVARIFARLPIRLLAACSFHGEQAVANLEKLRQHAERLGREGMGTLKEVIRQFQRHVLEVTEEGESVLAEENLDAVRIMSIHKAKGLEFPIVVLAGCQAGIDPRQGSNAEALSDWSTGLAGLRVGQTWNLAGLYITEKARLRSEQEHKRVLYVAATRAREHLIISCAPGERRASGSFVSLLDQSMNDSIDAAEESGSVTVGRGTVEIEVVSERRVAPGRAKARRQGAQRVPDGKSFVDAWKRRDAQYEKAAETPLFLTPTMLKRQESELAEDGGFRDQASAVHSPALLLGEIAHRFLQEWDFTADPSDFRERLMTRADLWLPPEFKRQRELIREELEEIFECFFASEPYRELKSSLILGREVPLLIPQNGQILQGVIDLLYERDGRLYLADYKTDLVDRNDLLQTAGRYRHQAQIYSTAARRALQRDVASFQLIFLRLGDAIEVEGV